MAERGLTGTNSRGKAEKAPDFNSRASQPSLPITRRRISKLGDRLWLYRYIILAGAVFVALNAVDAYLTNHAHRLVSNVDIESNPFMQAYAGSWLLIFKGLIALVVIWLVAWLRKATLEKILHWLVFGCMVFVGVILWNLYSLGMIR